MKKLSSNEVSVLSSEINKRINEVKYLKIKSKLEKDLDFKKLEKLKREIDELNLKVKEKMNLSNEFNLKIRKKYNINNVYIDNNNEMKLNFSINNNNNLYNDIVLMCIGKDFNVEELINKIVERYS
jgi:hypothetical protein